MVSFLYRRRTGFCMAVCNMDVDKKGMDKMTKSELTKAVFEKGKQGDFSSYAACERAVNHVWETISEQVIAGNTVSVSGFGQFEAVERAERQGRNPQTNEPMTIPASHSVKFKPYKALKDAVNE